MAIVIQFKPSAKQKEFLESDARRVVIPASHGDAPESVSPTGNWLRNMITMKCRACDHEWIQPADKGRCTVCRSDDTAPILKRFDASTRV
jgi:hypothetical protein